VTPFRRVGRVRRKRKHTNNGPTNRGWARSTTAAIHRASDRGTTCTDPRGRGARTTADGSGRVIKGDDFRGSFALELTQAAFLSRRACCRRPGPLGLKLRARKTSPATYTRAQMGTAAPGSPGDARAVVAPRVMGRGDGETRVIWREVLRGAGAMRSG